MHIFRMQNQIDCVSYLQKIPKQKIKSKKKSKLKKNKTKKK